MKRAWLAALAVVVALLATTTLSTDAATAAPAPSPSGSPAPSTPGKPGTSDKGKDAPRVTFGMAPATATGIDSRSSFGYRLLPTMKYSDHVAVLNYSSSPVKLTVDAVDLVNNSTGALDAALTHASSVGAGKWITLQHGSQVTLPAAKAGKGPGQTIVPFTVHLPAEVTPGDHGAAIVASLSSTGQGEHANVKLNQRVATRVIVRVPGDLKPALSVQDLHVDYKGTWNPVSSGKVHVSYTVKNTGNVILGATQQVSINGWLGASVSVPKAKTPDLADLLPGGSAKVSFDVDGVWPTLRGSAHVKLTPVPQPSDKDLLVKPVDASADFWTVPWAWLAILLVLLLVVIGAVLLRRRGKGKGGKGGRRGRGPSGPTGGDPIEPRELAKST